MKTGLLEFCDMAVYIVWHKKMSIVSYYAPLFMSLGRISALYSDIFSFLLHLAFFQTAQMQAVNLHEGNTNMEESEYDTEWGNSEQEKESEKPRQTRSLYNKKATLCFGYEKSDTDQKTMLCKLCCRPVPKTNSNITNCFYHLCKNYVKQSVRIPGWGP